MRRDTHTRVLLCFVAAVTLAAHASAPAFAQFPERTVRIVVPFDAGGTVDAVARALANRLNAKWNVPVIVENRPGAGNTIGASAVARAEPDGYTLLFANTSVSANPSLFKSLPYDTLKDLAPVVYLSPSPNVLLAQASLGVTTLKDLIALAKARAAKPLSYATVGRGSAHHFCMELLRSQAGIDLLHVPYRGVAPAVLAVTRGEVDLYCSDIPGALNLLKGGKVVPLGITSVKRAPILPDIPSFSEAGLPDYAATGYVGIMVTGGTPADVVHTLNAAINDVVRDPDFSRRFAEFGYDMVGGSVADFAAFLKEDIARYLKITKDAGIMPE
ncbi:MAG: tripartite tricarboxylate transporter substrate binding protein [Xanthobacteraceae bacterium]|nr:tripartite tricarboxylate transporter substrate binding protein [Xanthobacteraceae bacterium]